MPSHSVRPLAPAPRDGPSPDGRTLTAPEAEPSAAYLPSGYDVGATAAGVLRTCPLFAAVDDATYSSVMQYARRRRFRRDEVIYHAGDPGDSLLIVESGVVKVVVASDEGDEAIVFLRHPGQLIGVLSLLDDLPREMTTIALEPAELCSIPQERLLELIDTDLHARRALHAELAASIRALGRRIAEREFLALTGRIATRLVDLAQQSGLAGAGAVLPWPYTQSDLAAMVGGSRQRVNHVLGDLSSAGLLRVGRETIVIPDVEALVRVARQ